jgi:hypothetical protein
MSTKTSTYWKDLDKVFSNEEKMVKLTYDFADMGGTHTDVFNLGQFGAKSLVTKALVQVETACAGATATVIIGTTSDVDCFMDITAGAIANLADDYVVKQAAGQLTVAAADDYIVMDIGTASLTAGKINVYVWYINVA